MNLRFHVRLETPCSVFSASKPLFDPFSRGMARVSSRWSWRSSSTSIWPVHMGCAFNANTVLKAAPQCGHVCYLLSQLICHLLVIRRHLGGNNRNWSRSADNYSQSITLSRYRSVSLDVDPSSAMATDGGLGCCHAIAAELLFNSDGVPEHLHPLHYRRPMHLTRRFSFTEIERLSG